MENGKGDKMMRKFVIGLLVGAALMFSIQSVAATSTLVGSKVTKVMEVSLDGNQIGKAPVINGTGYLPIRTMSNGLGVTVDVKGAAINLTSPPEQPKFPYTMMEIDASIETIDNSIKLYQSQLDGYVSSGKADDPLVESLRTAIRESQAKLSVWQQLKVDIEAQATPTP